MVTSRQARTPAVRRLLSSTGLGLVACVVLSGVASATPAPDSGDYTPDSPAMFNAAAGKVTVEEHLGAQVPLDVPFVDGAGHRVTLGDAISGGDMPTLLTFNYSNCPNLCSLQLNGLVATLPSMEWKVGKQFRIVTIILDPTETATRTGETRSKYVKQLPPGSEAGDNTVKPGTPTTGWTFLADPTAQGPDAGASIRRVADAVGFKYTYLKVRAEYAHPAALIFLSPSGKVSRYVYDVQYQPAVLAESVARAGLGEASSAVGFMFRCFHYDSNANNHSHAGVAVLRYGAAAFAALFLGSLGLVHVLRRQRRTPSVVLGAGPEIDHDDFPGTGSGVTRS